MSDIVRKKLKVLNGSSFEPEITLKTVNNESLLGEGNVNTKYTAGNAITINNDIISVTDGSFATVDQLQAGLNSKENKIEDLFTIRSGAALGATALQNVPNTYRTSAEQDIIDADKANISDIPTKTSDLTNDSGFLTEHQDISGKQDRLTAGSGIIINNNIISADAQSFNIDACYPVGSVYFSTKIDESTELERGKWGCVLANIGGWWEEYETDVTPYAWERIGSYGQYLSYGPRSVTARNPLSKPGKLLWSYTFDLPEKDFDECIQVYMSCPDDFLMSYEYSAVEHKVRVNVETKLANYSAGASQNIQVEFSCVVIKY